MRLTDVTYGKPQSTWKQDRLESGVCIVDCVLGSSILIETFLEIILLSQSAQ